MIKNYFKIAWRSLWKNKLFSIINVISLAIGLSASFVIGLMVYYDFTFDKFHKDADLTYRITTEYSSPEGPGYSRGVAVPLTYAIKQGITGVKKSTAIFTVAPARVMNKSFTETFNDPEKVIYTDSGFFDFFEYEWLAGNPEAALQNPNEIVLTETRAKKYFPNSSYNQIIGKTLVYDDSTAVSITGIVSNFKDRTDFTFQEFISLQTASQSNMKEMILNDNWNSTNSNSQLFVKLNDKSALSNVQKQLDVLAKKNESEFAIKYNSHRNFHLQPLEDIHFNTNYGVFDFTEDSANKSTLVSLLWIAIFLLALACINFINLNTAQASQRAKEIGIRKTLGSSKKQLVYQFLGETFLLTIVAALLSIVLAAGLLKIFSDFIPEGLHFGLFGDPLIIGFGIILILLVSLLSGFYPALVLSSFKPVTVLKDKMASGNSNTSFRKGLIIFQFVIAQVFIISTLLVGKQIHFLMNQDIGISTEAIAHVSTPWEDDSMQKKELFIQKMKAVPQIEKLSLGGPPPASFSMMKTIADFKDGEKEINSELNLLFGDKDYLDIYEIELLAGRKLRNDTVKEYVINDTFRKILGFENPKDAIGGFVEVNEIQYPIVGVMADFNQRSLKSNIEPIAFTGDVYKSFSQFNTVHFQLNKADTQNWSKTIAKTEDVWKSVYPGSEFELKFMDETIAQFYKRETTMTKLLNWATGLSVLISCLGLLGLVIYTTERRVKEIGIRKILGASLAQLNILLCKDFMILVLLAFVIAAPLAWYGVNNWIQDYAYRTDLSWWIFILSGILMLGLALIIISIKTLSTATKNPVKSLRTE